MLAELLSSAMQHHRQGRLQEAEQLYREVLQQDPSQPNALYLLGLIAHQTGSLNDAIALYQQALVAQPDYADAHNNLGAAFQQQGNLEAAIAHYQAALRSKPDNPSANINLGVTLQQQGKLEAAIARYQKAIRLNPNLPEAHSNLGNALKEQGNLEQAIAHYETALQLSPHHPEAYRDLADTLQEQGKPAAAIALLDKAINLFPDHVKLRGSRIRTKLISGNLQDGFAEYDPWRLHMAGQPRPFTQPAWNGSDLDGKTILLYAEAGAGMGDTIQFIRYASLVAAKGGRVVVECQPSLIRLFQSVDGIDTLLEAGQPLPHFDVQASLLSLPYLFKTSVETIPANVPYLGGSEALRVKNEKLRMGTSTLNSQLSTLNSPLKVGIVWGGDPNHVHDRDRSCPIAHYQTFLQTPGVEFYSLQKGPHRAELVQISRLVEDISDRFQDFADTAEAIEQLDLVISVDTSVAHLAGAMGKPVWILLHFAPDWRWLMDRNDSPWYPTARLFRQQFRQDWAGVCQQVAKALNHLVITK